MTKFIDFAKPYFGDWTFLMELAAMVIWLGTIAAVGFSKQAYDRIRNDKMELEYFRERERKAQEAREDEE